MSTFFSLIYPTRHRPEFVRTALQFLRDQNYENFEIIISDNYIDPALSCEEICKNSGLKNLVYVRPNVPVGMVENWNYALAFAKGDYICYFTDKMFLLPGVLSCVNKLVLNNKPDIVTWLDNTFTPDDSSKYFESGIYKYSIGWENDAEGFVFYEPSIELSKRGVAQKSRFENTISEHARGKICYGAYSKELVKKILLKHNSLFQNISPDYTSMILGLSSAESAIEINRPGIVHLSVDISNGQKTMINDRDAYEFLSQLKNPSDIISNMLVPGLYSCQHNIVAHDYLNIKKSSNLEYSFNQLNWLVYIYEDFDVINRKWSSRDIEIQHRNLYQNFLNNNLDELSRTYVYSKIEFRKSIRKNNIKSRIKTILRKFLPEKLYLYLSQKLHGYGLIRLSRLDALLP